MPDSMSIDVDQQQQHHQSQRDPAQPSYVLRGHTAHVHSVQIVRRNTCVLTGDADGWLVCWTLDTKRPLAVWKAHDAAILGTAEWGPDKIITHGRDNALRIWQLNGPPASYSTVLPVDGADAHRPKPWLLHSLPVNTLNFCAFAVCYQNSHAHLRIPRSVSSHPPTRSSEAIYIAVPGRDDNKAEVYQFPDEKLICVVPRVEASETGMVMTLKLTHHQPSNNILVIAGYEGGFTAVHVVPRPTTGKRRLNLDVARTIYLSQPHTQPVLSLDALPDGSAYFTSSADAVIAAHRVPGLPLDTLVSDDGTEESATDVVHPQTINGDDGSAASEHAVMTNDEDSEALATAKNTKSSSSGASRDSSPPALSFSKTRPPPAAPSTSSVPQASGLSTLLAAAPPQSTPTSASEIPAVVTVQAPYKISDTKHAGQQSLRVRSDGRLFITGGWDSRVRIYSTRTLKEMAVLKWHKEGVYAAGFGEIINEEDSDKSVEQPVDGASESVVRRETGLKKLQRQREEVIRGKHWAVAGAKDGRVSLWEVF